MNELIKKLTKKGSIIVSLKKGGDIIKYLQKEGIDFYAEEEDGKLLISL